MSTVKLRQKIGEYFGEWEGDSFLYLEPKDAPLKSHSVAKIGPVAGLGFFEMRYSWSFSDKNESGLILFRLANQPGDADIVWMDSWHMGSKFMICKGETSIENTLCALGTYEAPPGPDWAWRIVFSAISKDQLFLQMFNISPEGQECLAVETSYLRRV